MNNELLKALGLLDETGNKRILDYLNPIPYVKELRKLKCVDSTETCLLMAKFEMLFSQNPNGFCKYQRPCAWQIKSGESSWLEDLGVTRSVLNRIFKEIVTSYRTKEEYLLAEDKFKGKYYCSYIHTPDNSKTYYFRNDELVNKGLKMLLAEHLTQ